VPIRGTAHFRRSLSRLLHPHMHTIDHGTDRFTIKGHS
jgi:hypothetical protein